MFWSRVSGGAVFYKHEKKRNNEKKKAFSNKYIRDKMNAKSFILKTLIKNNL